MARLVFPDDPFVLRPGAPGANVRNAAGAVAVVFSDAAGSQLADIVDINDQSVPGSVLYVDAYSRLPLFSGPDGVDTVYISVDDGPIVPVYARADDRFDSLESRVGAVETGPVWNTYTPQWTADSGNPVLAAGTAVTGRYIYLNEHTVKVGIGISTTAGSTKGSGAYAFTLPVNRGANATFQGTFHMLDAGVKHIVGSVEPDGVNRGIVRLFVNGGGSFFGSGDIAGNMTGSYVNIDATYEV